MGRQRDVIASAAKQSRWTRSTTPGLLRCARNDGFRQARTNSSSTVRCRNEKLSSEIRVSTVFRPS
ncbi:MAG: hypothetical protein C0447_15110 [Methylobacterium sp.]|nr:hypothetical protein [Methylobacterium sp.]